ERVLLFAQEVFQVMPPERELLGFQDLRQLIGGNGEDLRLEKGGGLREASPQARGALGKRLPLLVPSVLIAQQMRVHVDPVQRRGNLGMNLQRSLQRGRALAERPLEAGDLPNCVFDASEFLVPI